MGLLVRRTRSASLWAGIGLGCVLALGVVVARRAELLRGVDEGAVGVVGIRAHLLIEAEAPRQALGPEARLRRRKEKAAPLVVEFRVWMGQAALEALPKVRARKTQPERRPITENGPNTGTHGEPMSGVASCKRLRG